MNVDSEDNYSDNEMYSNEILLNIFKEKIDELQKFVNEFIITDEEKMQLYETAYNLVCETIQGDPMIYIYPNFHNIVIKQISELLTQQLGNIFINENYINEIINTSIEVGLQLFYKNVSPNRSYKYTKSDVRSVEEINNILEKINYLKSVPQPEQRTQDWFAFRQNTLTASNIWKAFSTQNTKNQLIYEKCIPFDEKKYNNHPVNTSSAMHWGQRFEPISIMYYESKYNTKIGDFGCISHKNINYLAASPDGINILKDSSNYGRMLEIKNVVSRVINGIPKMEYWIQMQIQMEVCDLDECDFLETRFIEYENVDEFNKDFSISPFHKGLIMFFNDNGKPHYEYSKWGSTKDEIEKWENEMLEKNNKLILIQNIYWKLVEVSCVLVLRNKLWFDVAKPVIENIWNTILIEKESGEYIKRGPKKKIIKNISEIKSNCLIDINMFNYLKEDDNIYDISGLEMEIIPELEYDDEG